MHRVIVTIRRKAGMSREEFLRHWQQDHPAFVARMPGIRGYRQSAAIEHRREWPYDGMAELLFETVRDIAAAFDSPQARELFAHEEEFLDETTWFIADDVREIQLDAVRAADWMARDSTGR